MDTDPAVMDSFEGMKPDIEKHGTIADIEPVSLFCFGHLGLAWKADLNSDIYASMLLGLLRCPNVRVSALRLILFYFKPYYV